MIIIIDANVMDIEKRRQFIRLAILSVKENSISNFRLLSISA